MSNLIQQYKRRGKRAAKRITKSLSLRKDYFDDHNDLIVLGYVTHLNWMSKGRFVTSHKIARALHTKWDKDVEFSLILVKLRKLNLVTLDESTIRIKHAKNKYQKAEYVIEDLMYEASRIRKPTQKVRSLKPFLNDWRRVKALKARDMATYSKAS